MIRKHVDYEHWTFPTAGRFYSWQVEAIIFRKLKGAGKLVETVTSIQMRSFEHK
jgi:hypothetical protein